MEPQIGKEHGLDDPPPSYKPWDVVLIWVVRLWPGVAMMIIGAGLTWYYMVFGHHPLFLSLLYGYGLILLLMWVVNGMLGLKDIELSCGCLLAVVVGLYLVMMIQANQRAESHHATHAMFPTPPRR